MGVLATSTTIDPAELAVTNNIRVVAMSIAAYEYGLSCLSLPLIVAHIRLVISSPSLGNIDCISPPTRTKGGKKVDTSLRGNDLHSICSIGWA
jgi:hypothetical protein